MLAIIVWGRPRVSGMLKRQKSQSGGHMHKNTNAAFVRPDKENE
jgi:hypothetical protein